MPLLVRSPPARLCGAALLSAISMIPCVTVMDRSHAADAEEDRELQTALERVAARILPFTQGDFAPSPPPRLLNKLTDNDLVLARLAVWRVAAQQEPPPSGAARFRLLAWTVADARGAPEPLSNAVALKVGKRLEAQALSVRNESYDQPRLDRLAVMSRMEADPSFGPSVEAAIAAIDETARLATERSRREVYVGFHELQPSLPPAPTAPPPDSSDEDQPAPSPSTDSKPAHRACPSREGRVVQFPWLLEEHLREQGLRKDPVPIPPDLAEALGPEDVQVFLARTDLSIYTSSAVWWSVALPSFARSLLCELAEQRVQHREAARKIIARIDDDERRHERITEYHKKLLANYEEMLGLKDEVHKESLEEANSTIAELRVQLREAKAREDALHAVIANARS